MTRRTRAGLAARAGWACLIGLALLGAACGTDDQLEIQIAIEPGQERLDDLTRLDYRVYTVEDVDEILATATNPNGTPVQAISCDVLKTAAPEAADCTEEERRITRDQDLVATGQVPADGVLSVDGGQRVRVYASLRPDQLRMDEHGHVCSWNGNEVFSTNTAAGEVRVRPFC